MGTIKALSILLTVLLLSACAPAAAPSPEQAYRSAVQTQLDNAAAAWDMYTQAQKGTGDCHDSVTACLMKSLDKYSAVADALDALTPPTPLTQVDAHVKACARYTRQFANDSRLGLQNGDADLLDKAVVDKKQADGELATIKTMLK